MGRAKGTAFFHDEQYVKQTYGPETWAQIVAAMPAAAAEVRSSIVAVGWYDDALLVQTLRTVEDVLREREPRIIEMLGRYAAEQDLTRIHRVFLRTSPSGTPSAASAALRSAGMRFAGSDAVHRIGV